jgi:hypothetical protein
MSAALAAVQSPAGWFRLNWKPLVGMLLVLHITLTLAPAQAQSLDDIANVLDKINGLSAGALPFSGDDLRKYRDLISGCASASSSDDVVACVETASASDLGQQAGIPSWFPEMLEVYFDLEHQDYWGLLEDAGEAAACAAAQVLAFGLDVCAAIQELIAAAKAVASAAEAIGEFFEDLGSDLADIGQDIYCWFSSCSSGPPPPSDDAVAYQNFYFPRIQTGLNKRLQGQSAWVAYAGAPTTTQQGSIVDEGIKAGYKPGPLMDTLPAFRSAVYAQWDSTILTKIAPAARQAASAFNSYANVQAYAQAGIAAWSDDYIDQLGPNGAIPFPLQNPGMQACEQAVIQAGGQQVDDWVADGGPLGGPAHPKVPKGFQWPGNYAQLCTPFGKQLSTALRAPVAARAAAYLPKICQNKGGAPTVYACTMYAVQNCQNILAFTGAPGVCKNVSPNPGTSKGTYICQPGNVVRTFVLTAPHPANCRLASVQNGPPPPSPTFGGQTQR